jgi:hypothetical protein
VNTLKIIEEDGFGIFPEVLLPRETRRLIDDLDQSPLKRSWRAPRAETPFRCRSGSGAALA